MVSHRVECPLCSAGITDFLSHSWFPGKLTNERKYVIRPDVGECTRGRRLPAKGFYHNLMLLRQRQGLGFGVFCPPPPPSPVIYVSLFCSLKGYEPS